MRRLKRNVARNYAQSQGITKVNRRMGASWRMYLRDAIQTYAIREAQRKRRKQAAARA